MEEHVHALNFISHGIFLWLIMIISWRVPIFLFGHTRLYSSFLVQGNFLSYLISYAQYTQYVSCMASSASPVCNWLNLLLFKVTAMAVFHLLISNLPLIWTSLFWFIFLLCCYHYCRSQAYLPRHCHFINGDCWLPHLPVEGRPSPDYLYESTHRISKWMQYFLQITTISNTT